VADRRDTWIAGVLAVGVHSTVDITRYEATRLIKLGLYTATDEELAGALFVMFGDRTLNNYCVEYRDYRESDFGGILAVELAIDDREESR
jgi:hypothetical protein